VSNTAFPSTPRVLVLDDDVNILSAFEDFFKREKCTMIPAVTAEDAMEKASNEHFDLLITDIRLQSQSGVSFFLQAKSIQPALPVIVITGYPDSVDEAQVKALGADFLLVKPLELERLREAVRACLRRKNR
jgi:DNA-binding response OmpR family regulator